MTGFVINNESPDHLGGAVGIVRHHPQPDHCKAMNRSLANVLFRRIRRSTATGGGKSADGLTVKSNRAGGSRRAMAYAQNDRRARVRQAVAQAQHQVRELADMVEKRVGR